MWDEARKYASKIIFFYKGKILNKPCSLEELYNLIPLEKKILVAIDSGVSLENVISYENKSNVVFLIEKGEQEVLRKIKEKTTNYTIMPVEIEDLYYYLINAKQ